MANKSQASVLSVILLTGISVAILSITYLWAQPMITQNVDTLIVNNAIDFMKNLNQDIIDSARTGSSKTILANLEKGNFAIDSIGNRIIIELSSTAKIIQSNVEKPLNFYELPLKKEIFYLNNLTDDETQELEGFESKSRRQSITINGTIYNASIFNNSETFEFDTLCLWKESIDYFTDCGNIDESILKEGTSYYARTINPLGANASFYGDLIENKGVFGQDVSGIISAKSFNVGNTEHVTLYLTYRALIDESGNEYKIIINCKNNCVFSGEEKKIYISRQKIENIGKNLYIYINLEVE